MTEEERQRDRADGLLILVILAMINMLIWAWYTL